MKKLSLGAILAMALLFGISATWAQQVPTANTNPISKYDYYEAFSPLFYSKNGTATRSASGQPGA